MAMKQNLLILGNALLLILCLTVTAHCSHAIKRSALEHNAERNDAPPETWFQVTGLNVVSVRATRAEVKWIKSTGPVVGYELRVCTKWMPRVCEKTDVAEANQKLQNLKPSTAYQVMVRPFDDSKPRVYGHQVVVEFTTHPFPVVRDLTATALGSRSIEVKWAAPQEEVIGYMVHGYGKGGGFVEANTSVTTVTFSNLNPEETYTIEVKTFKREGEELTSGVPVIVSATTTTLQPPTDVNLQATCDHRILASWNYTGDPPTGFELKLCGHVQQSCLHKTAAPEERFFNFKIAPEELMFTFIIQSSVYGFAGHLSEAVVKNISSIKRAPRIEHFKVSPVDNKSIEVSWDGIQGGEMGIEICLATTPKSLCTNYSTDGADSKYWISGLEEGAHYIISANFKPNAEGPVCLNRKTSLNFTVPFQAPEHNTASLPVQNGLLLVITLLYLLI